MNLAAISLAALLIAVVVSCTSKLNVGVLAIVLAWIVGVYLGGMKLEVILSGFPTNLFLTLVGMVGTMLALVLALAVLVILVFGLGGLDNV